MLREAEYRSTYPLPYWNVPLLRWLVPRQRRCQEALRLINATLDSLIAESKRLVTSCLLLRSPCGFQVSLLPAKCVNVEMQPNVS